MSGHSKWHRIKHKKAAADAKRGAQFTKLAQQIKAAARNGTDPSKNNALADAIDHAKAANMPQVNIDRLLSTDADSLKSVTYECFGPGGTSLIVIASTDNTNRTISELRTILKNHGGSPGQTGSVMWKFKQMSQVTTELPKANQMEAIELELIDAGAEDITTNNDELTIISQPSLHSAIENTLSSLGLTIISSEVEYIATDPTHSNEDTQEKLDNLVNELLDHPDIEQVYTDVV